jgi:hypothetical protein
VAGSYIDCHVHLFPPDRLRKLIRWSRRFLPEHPTLVETTAEEVIDQLRRAGATRWANLLFPLAPGEAHELHRFNAELAERCPGMVPFGGVLAADTDPLGIVQEAVERWGMAGLKFHPMVQRFSPAEPVLEPVFRYLEERDRAVYIHTGYDEWYGWELPGADVERLALDHPGLAVVLPHLGYPRLGWAFDLAERCPNVWLDATNVFGTLGGRIPPFEHGDLEAQRRELLSRLPPLADRVMFGTDHPVGMGSLEQIFTDLGTFDLDEATRERILLSTPAAFLDRYGRRWD